MLCRPIHSGFGKLLLKLSLALLLQFLHSYTGRCHTKYTGSQPTFFGQVASVGDVLNARSIDRNQPFIFQRISLLICHLHLPKAEVRIDALGTNEVS